LYPCTTQKHGCRKDVSQKKDGNHRPRQSVGGGRSTFDNHSAQGQIDFWQPFPTLWRGQGCTCSRDARLFLPRAMDCRTNMPHIRQSRSDSGVGFQALVRSHDLRRWLFEEPTQSRISPSVLQNRNTQPFKLFPLQGCTCSRDARRSTRLGPPASASGSKTTPGAQPSYCVAFQAAVLPSRVAFRPNFYCALLRCCNEATVVPYCFTFRFRASRDQRNIVCGLAPEIQGQNLAMTLFVHVIRADPDWWKLPQNLKGGGTV
jgi:hypothetical protein